MPPMTHMHTLKGDQGMDVIPPSVQLTLSYDIRLLFENFCHQTSQFPQPFDWSSDLISFELIGQHHFQKFAKNIRF